MSIDDESRCSDHIFYFGPTTDDLTATRPSSPTSNHVHIIANGSALGISITTAYLYTHIPFQQLNSHHVCSVRHRRRTRRSDRAG